MSFFIRAIARQVPPTISRRGVATLPGSGQLPHGIINQLSSAAPALFVGSLAGGVALAWRLSARRALLTTAEKSQSSMQAVDEWKAWAL